ncbi:MAG: hypothetical protein VW378_07870 [bacterium]
MPTPAAKPSYPPLLDQLNKHKFGLSVTFCVALQIAAALYSLIRKCPIADETIPTYFDALTLAGAGFRPVREDSSEQCDAVMDACRSSRPLSEITDAVLKLLPLPEASLDALRNAFHSPSTSELPDELVPWSKFVRCAAGNISWFSCFYQEYIPNPLKFDPFTPLLGTVIYFSQIPNSFLRYYFSQCGESLEAIVCPADNSPSTRYRDPRCSISLKVLSLATLLLYQWLNYRDSLQIEEGINSLKNGWRKSLKCAHEEGLIQGLSSEQVNFTDVSPGCFALGYKVDHLLTDIMYGLFFTLVLCLTYYDHYLPLKPTDTTADDPEGGPTSHAHVATAGHSITLDSPTP